MFKTFFNRKIYIKKSYVKYSFFDKIKAANTKLDN